MDMPPLNMPELNIGRASLADIRAISEIHLASCQQVYPGMGVDDWLQGLKDFQKRDAFWKEKLEKGDWQFLVARAGEEVVGFTAFGRLYEKELSGCGEVYRHYVHPSHWKKGLGKGLLLSAENQLRAEGYNRCGIWVLQDNQVGQGFFKSQGYVMSDESDWVTMGIAKVREVRYYKEL